MSDETSVVATEGSKGDDAKPPAEGAGMESFPCGSGCCFLLPLKASQTDIVRWRYGGLADRGKGID